jgi:hypothetical protein
MVIDALELLYTDRPDAFGIVSSDADFTPLVMHLQQGAAVYGFGSSQTPEPFVNACSRFLVLAPAEPPQAQGVAGGLRCDRAAAGAGERLRGDTRLVNLLRSAISAAKGRGRLGPGRWGRPCHQQSGLLRLAQLWIFHAQQAAQGD